MEIRPFSSTTLPGYLPLVSSDIKAGASCNSQFPVDGSLKAVSDIQPKTIGSVLESIKRKKARRA
ncbi:hypothetical protein P3S68_024919 [Capsicum galapagoense]